MEKNIVLKNEKGEDVKYDILFSFDIPKNEKTYLLYTDYSKDENGNLIIYSACFLSGQKNAKLMRVETPEETNLINSILEFIQNQLKNDSKKDKKN